ncbi:carbohydrate esterase family 1 protein [Ramaria rubella]|nr:carbohydrate esterase family 1 protein [Ramaria rubella]
MSELEKVSSNKTFGGELIKFKFPSPALGHTTAKFNVFIPDNIPQGEKAPVLFYLAGLECTEDHGPQKGGFLRDAAAEVIAIVFPDTSPRGAGVAGEDDDWTFGTGAGFYIDATAPKYSKHYNMYTHIRSEIPYFLQKQNLPLNFDRQSIFGHSMGGHGALTLYLKALDSSHTKPYLSASAFAPITNPTQCPWGYNAFKGYLQEGIEEGRSHDATELISKVKGKVNILVDYGDADKFYQTGQLLPENFIDAARKAGHDSSEVQVRNQPGYDHSYYFISSFAADHIKFHSAFLNAQ